MTVWVLYCERIFLCVERPDVLKFQHMLDHVFSLSVDRFRLEGSRKN